VPTPCPICPLPSAPFPSAILVHYRAAAGAPCGDTTTRSCRAKRRLCAQPYPSRPSPPAGGSGRHVRKRPAQAGPAVDRPAGNDAASIAGRDALHGSRLQAEGQPLRGCGDQLLDADQREVALGA
jgi:hypothetical protein